MAEKLNLNKKESWSIFNARIIADDLKYYYTEPFKLALNKFIVELAIDANPGSLLEAVAIGYFDKIKPPLERKKNEISSTFPTQSSPRRRT
jgi:hypothetical protein